MSPRVLITGINYAPELTGIAVYTTNLAEGLATRGWDVRVLTGLPHYPAWRPLPLARARTHGRVRVIRRPHFIPSRQSVTLRAAYESSWLSACLPTLLKGQEADVVLGVTPSLGGGVLAALAGLRSRVPYVLMIQDLVGQAARQSELDTAGTVSAALGATEVLLARRAAHVAVVAEGFRSHLVERGVPPERVHRVRNPVHMQPPRRARAEVRRRLGWADEEFVVLHSGNMGLKQGLENVIRAARLAEGARRIRFVLQGDGSQRPRLEREARELRVGNVDFLPLAPAGELAEVLAAADVLLLNQRRQIRDMSLPSKLTCYFASGVPVLAAVAGGSEAGRDVIASGGGVLVEPERPDELVRGLTKLMNAPEQRRQLGMAGRAFAEAELNPDTLISQMERLLQATLAGRPAASEVLA